MRISCSARDLSRAGCDIATSGVFSFLRRGITWGLTQWKDMMLILVTISIIQVTGGGVAMIPCRCLKTEGVNIKPETSCTANDITRQIEKHVFSKDARRMSD
jgi:hypothetical protein